MGRPKSNVNPEDINKIIQMYRQETGSSSELIEYKDIYEFNATMHAEGKWNKAFKDSFWRKIGQPGRTAVDLANDLIRSKIATFDNNITIPDIRLMVYKYVEDPEKLIKKVEPLKNSFYAMNDKVKKLTDKVEKLESLLEFEKDKRRKKEEEAKRLQDCLFKMFRYSDSDDNTLINQLRIKNPVTNKYENKRIANALENLFDNPMQFYTMFEAHRGTGSKNVIPIEQKRSILDDFKRK